jgi:transposase
MGKPYSMDLRERVVATVETGGLSCHQAAAQFGVGVHNTSTPNRCSGAFQDAIGVLA